MRSLDTYPNIDNSDLVKYPQGRIKNDTGPGDGTPIDEMTNGDLQQFFAKLMRLYAIEPNQLPDNETNGFQLIEALIAIASKNDYLLPITTDGTVLGAGVKIGKLISGETIRCKAAADWTAESTITGSDGLTTAFTKIGEWKANEHLILVKTGSTILLIRDANSISIEAMVAELLFLRAASNPQEIAGVLNTVATTPASNLIAFFDRVTGANSATFLATAMNNGLYPKEHYAIVAALGNDPVRNIGTASGIDINSGASGTTYAVSGDIVSATKTSSGDLNGSIIRIVVANTMTDSDYYVRIFVESLSASMFTDSNIQTPTFKVINATTFDICIKQTIGISENLKLNFEVVKKLS